MAFPLNPPYATLTTAGFIPTLWSKKLNAAYYVDNQLTEVVNTNWEGEIKNQGDTVRIRTAPRVTTFPYAVGMTLPTQVLEPTFQDFTIDQGLAYNFAVPDVLEAQADLNLMSMYTEDAARSLKEDITDNVFFETFVGGAAAAGTATRPAHADNQGASAGTKSHALQLGTDAAPITTATPNNLLALILQLATALSEQNAPTSGRFLLLSPFDHQILMQSDLGKAYITGDATSMLRTGKVGMLDLFTVYVSNMLPRGDAGLEWVSGMSDPTTGAAYSGAADRRMVIAGHKDAITFANQVTTAETLRNPNDFGDMVRGLSVFGRKVVKPEALAVGIVY
jgi:hypothetical protein